MDQRRRIGRWLAYINRARQYIGIVNSSFLIIILLGTYDVKLTWYWYPAMVIVALMMFLIIGFIDTHSGVRKNEIRNMEENSPLHMEMYRDIKKIKEKLDEEFLEEQI